MPIITFWSNNEKSIGQTTSAIVTATVAAIEHNYKVLLISADLNDNMIEKSFGAQETNKEIIKGIVQKSQISLDSGIQGLLKLSDSNRVAPEMIHDYTKIIFKNRLEVLSSPTVLGDEREEKVVLDKMKNIIMNASKYYDYVFVDLKKGIRHSEQLDILDISDVVVSNIDQRLETIEELLNRQEVRGIFRKIIWNICKNDKNSKYNAKNLLRKVLKKETICEIDYNTLVFEATQEGSIPDLMIKFRTLREDDPNMQFLTKVRNLVEEILMKYRQSRS